MEGAGTIPEERSEDTLELFKEYYETLRTEKRLNDDRLWRIQCCDIENLDFEEELITGFIRTVRNFQQFSDHVEVILLPRNHDWIGRPPDAEERLRRVLERIRQETGVTIHSFEDAPEITPQMYSDTTHLARYSGDEVFTRFLADEYGPRHRFQPPDGLRWELDPVTVSWQQNHFDMIGKLLENLNHPDVGLDQGVFKVQLDGIAARV